MELKDMLNTHLVESKETVDKFAARAGVGRATVFRVKQGEYGDYSKIKKIIDALGKPLVILPNLPPPEPHP